jgi:hypothetical protein
MEFYTAATGVEFSVTWKDAEEFGRAKTFLTELAGPPAGRATPGEPEYYYFETEEQCRALFRFQRELRGAAASSKA